MDELQDLASQGPGLLPKTVIAPAQDVGQLILIRVCVQGHVEHDRHSVWRCVGERAPIGIFPVLGSTTLREDLEQRLLALCHEKFLSATLAHHGWSHLPNGVRLSCGALKKDSFLNLRAPSASSAG